MTASNSSPEARAEAALLEDALTAAPATPRRLGRRAQWSRRVKTVVSESVLRGVSSAARMHPRARAARGDVEIIANLNYVADGSIAHQLDVYRPRGCGTLRPVVLYIHGGGFCTCSKDTHWPLALMFARAGYVVLTINYRLAPQHPFPAALEDTCAAYEWALDNVHRYGGDAARMVVAGESAGANLALAVTVASCYRRPEPFAQRVFARNRPPRVCMPYCGILEVSRHARFGERRKLPRVVTDVIADVAQSYLGSAPSAELASPLVVLEEQHPDRPLPALFSAVGTRDPLLDDTRRLEQIAAARGAVREMHYYPGEMHAFFALVWRPAAQRCWRDSFAFLERHVPAGP